jgi:predicted glutamine amidotransferase
MVLIIRTAALSQDSCLLRRHIVPIAGELMHNGSLEGFSEFNKRGIGEEVSAEAMRVAFIVICHSI